MHRVRCAAVDVLFLVTARPGHRVQSEPLSLPRWGREGGPSDRLGTQWRGGLPWAEPPATGPARGLGIGPRVLGFGRGTPFHPTGRPYGLAADRGRRRSATRPSRSFLRRPLAVPDQRLVLSLADSEMSSSFPPQRSWGGVGVLRRRRGHGLRQRCHDPSARYAGTSPSRSPRRGGMLKPARSIRATGSGSSGCSRRRPATRRGAGSRWPGSPSRIRPS